MVGLEEFLEQKKDTGEEQRQKMLGGIQGGLV